MSYTQLSLTDLDALVILTQGLHEANTPGKRDTLNLLDSEDDVLKMRAKALDSLAFLSVSEPRGEVIAIGAKVSQNVEGGGVVVLVAANGTRLDRRVAEHLRNILDQLKEIRTAYLQLPESDPSPRSRVPSLIQNPPSTPYEDKLFKFRIALIKHSWLKLGQRFRKNHRPRDFMETAHWVLHKAPLQGDNQQLNKDQAPVLATLRAEAAGSYEKTLERGLVMVEKLDRRLTLQTPEDKDCAFVAEGLLFMHSVSGKCFRPETTFAKNWDIFTKSA